MKQYVLVFLLILPLLYGYAQSADTAILNHCPDYYNPFALSQKWTFDYPGKLASDQVIVLSFTIRKINRDKPFTLVTQLRKGQTKGDIYLFVLNKAMQCEISIAVVPGEINGGSWIFNHKFPANYTIIRQTWQKISLRADQENSLSGIFEENEATAPRLTRDMICEKTTVLSPDSSGEKTTSTPLDLDVKIKMSLRSLSSHINEPSQDFSGLSDETLAQRKRDIEKKFLAGKGSITELNAVQREIIRRTTSKKE